MGDERKEGLKKPNTILRIFLKGTVLSMMYIVIILVCFLYIRTKIGKPFFWFPFLMFLYGILAASVSWYIAVRSEIHS